MSRKMSRSRVLNWFVVISAVSVLFSRVAPSQQSLGLSTNMLCKETMPACSAKEARPLRPRREACSRAKCARRVRCTSQQRSCPLNNSLAHWRLHASSRPRPGSFQRSRTSRPPWLTRERFGWLVGESWRAHACAQLSCRPASCRSDHGGGVPLAPCAMKLRCA